MRQIIQTPWVGNSKSNIGSVSRFSSTQQRGDSMSILTDTKERTSDILSSTNPNESIDSSFEVSNQSHKTSQTSRCNPTTKSPKNNAAIQSACEISWDAVFGNSESVTSNILNSNDSVHRKVMGNEHLQEDNIRGSYHPKSIPRSRKGSDGSPSVVVTPSPSAKKTIGKPRNYLTRTQQTNQQQQQPESMSSMSAVSSSVDNSRTIGGSRISRLASLFSSRAVTAPESIPPPSPPRSESSTGYVGWPGTQDKQGATVMAESSYEESEVSGDKVKAYQQEVQLNVERELTSWIDDADVIDSDFSTEKKNQPIKPSSRVDYDKTHRLGKGKKCFPSSSLSLSHANIDNGLNFIQANGQDNENSDHIIKDNNAYIGSDSYRRDENTTSTSNVVAVEPYEDDMSDLSTSYSKTSSAYFNPREVQGIQNGHTRQLFGNNQKRLAAATVMRRCLSSSAKRSQQLHHRQSLQSLTEETLAMKDQLTPPTRHFNNVATVGFRGLLDRTRDVPNLMDETGSEGTSAISATSRHSSDLVKEIYNNNNGDDHATYIQHNSSSSPCPSATRYRCRREKQGQKQYGTIMEEVNINTTTDIINCNLKSTDNGNFHFTSNKMDVGSDVFDGISNADPGEVSIHSVRRSGVTYMNRSRSEEEDGKAGILGATSRSSMERINLALLGGGLTTIQTTAGDFTNRRTSSDFDETLTNSDYDQYGFVKIPTFHVMAAAGTSQHDRSLSSQSLLFANLPSQRSLTEIKQNKKDHIYERKSGGLRISNHHHLDMSPHGKVKDFSDYYILPEEMQTLVKKFRKISRSRYPQLNHENLENEEDSTKAFALSEMRSRIMEKDIERGLERRGGTNVVDDIVMTAYNRAALRVRDAVIVAKAWRDGATPQDVINTANLTRRVERCYCIPRLKSTVRSASKYTWEEVNWVDDNDLSRYRCHSIGPRHLKGMEIFTIGDCVSILLKLCNERRKELRTELNNATADQIEAEICMKEEGETEGFDGMMTEAEMTYLTSMEQVKSISQKLVLAEKAFTLVKNRIEKLVEKYETLLVRFENETESVAPSSVFSYESSCYSEDYSFAAAKEREQETLARRAQRAELRAEVVAREFILANRGVKATTTRKEKEIELDNLKLRLADMQSESSAAFTEKDRSVVLARAITRTNQSNRSSSRDGGGVRGRGNGRQKIEGIKKRFRDRSAAKFQFDSQKQNTPSLRAASYNNHDDNDHFHRTVGEEMFQHLDFYERSLKAVEESNQR